MVSSRYMLAVLAHLLADLWHQRAQVAFQYHGSSGNSLIFPKYAWGVRTYLDCYTCSESNAARPPLKPAPMRHASPWSRPPLTLAGGTVAPDTIPCLRRQLSFLKQVPSTRRFRRCCLISSKISGWIFSFSSLWRTNTQCTACLENSAWLKGHPGRWGREVQAASSHDHPNTSQGSALENYLLRVSGQGYLLKQHYRFSDIYRIPTKAPAASVTFCYTKVSWEISSLVSQSHRYKVMQKLTWLCQDNKSSVTCPPQKHVNSQATFVIWPNSNNGQPCNYWFHSKPQDHILLSTLSLTNGSNMSSPILAHRDWDNDGIN